jgi:hypothetical protein
LVNDGSRQEAKRGAGEIRGFFTEFLKGLVQDAFKFIIAFVVGTGAGAIVCWYYDIPLVFSLVGDFLVCDGNLYTGTASLTALVRVRRRPVVSALLTIQERSQ